MTCLGGSEYDLCGDLDQQQIPHNLTGLAPGHKRQPNSWKSHIYHDNLYLNRGIIALGSSYQKGIGP